MARSRLVLAGTLLLVLVTLVLPAVSLAGGSAGDQQYTDPFSGGGGSQTAPTTTSSSAPATTTASGPAPATTTVSPAPAQTTPSPAAATSTASSPVAGSAQTVPADPTATIAGGTSSTLPYTGYDAWTAVGFGLTLVVGGVVLRRRTRAHRS